MKFIYLLFFIYFSFSSSILSEEWEDLDEGEKKEVYGSEKNRKFPISAVIIELEKWENHKSFTAFGIFRNREYPKYKSLYFFPFYNSLKSKMDEREKFRLLNYNYTRDKNTVDRSFFPFVFWGNNFVEKSNYNAILPFYYYANKEDPGNTGFTFAVFPLPFYYSTSSYPIYGNDRHFETTHFSLLHYRSYQEDRSEFIEIQHKSVWGFPVLPFVFYSNYEQGRGINRRILTLFSSDHSEKGELNSISLFPFFFYKKNDYLNIPILLFSKDLSKPSASYGRTFFPLLLYYNKWDPSSETFFFIGYYSSSNSGTKEKLKTIFPVYWDYESENRSLTALLPLYLKYKDKENDYNINPLFFTRANSGIIKPELNIGKKEEKWYLDTDLTVLYYLFSFSLRQTLETPKFFREILPKVKTYEEIEEEKKKAKAEEILAQKGKTESSNPALKKKRSFTREDSLNFWGYSMFFGIHSYEAADSKRHFRLLPFSWLTWDKNSDDKIITFLPFYVLYKSEELEYNVVFPFYGRQKDQDSEKSAYLINGFISEYYKSGNRTEYSLLWPLANYYTSDTNDGHRILPLYIYKKFKNQTGDYSESYTLTSYYISLNHISSDFKSNTTRFYFWPALIYYNNYETQNLKNESNSKFNRQTMFVTPFFYRSSSNEYTRTNLFWFVDWKYNYDAEKKSSLDYLLVFPFYYTKGFNFLFPISFNSTNEDGFTSFTFLNYIENDKVKFYYNFLYLMELEYEKKSTKRDFSLFFTSIQYHKKNEASKIDADSYFRFLRGYGWDVTYRNGNLREISLLSWLGLGYRNDGNQTGINFTPLFIDIRDSKKFLNFTLGNWMQEDETKFRNNYLFLIDYEKFKIKNEYKWDFLFTSIRYHNLSKEQYFDGFWGYGWNFRQENNIWTDTTFLWLGYTKRNSETVYNFLPVYRSYDSVSEKSRIYGPMLLYTSEDKSSDFQLGLLGAGYWHNKDRSTGEENSYYLLGTIYREVSKKERGYKSRGSFWGILWDYQTEDNGFSKFSVLKIFSYVDDPESNTKKFMGITL